MKRKALVIAPLIVINTLMASCAQQEAGLPLEEVTVQLAWTHGAQFAGFYAADQFGYYAEQGLEVTLRPRSEPSTNAIEEVADGRSDFGLIATGVGLFTGRSQNVPVIAVAAIYRRNPLVFITLEESGITRPHEIIGHTIRALNPAASGLVFSAMMSNLGLDPDSVEQVESEFDLSPFYRGEVDVWVVYLTDEVISARDQGHAVNLILPDDYGVHLYGDTLFTTDQLVEDNPELVQRFLDATLRGWRWAVENPQAAAQLALEYDPALDAAHQVNEMEASVPLVHTGEDQIGWMRAEAWQGIHDILLEQGILSEPVDLDTVYTMEFLHSIYGQEP